MIKYRVFRKRGTKRNPEIPVFFNGIKMDDRYPDFKPDTYKFYSSVLEFLHEIENYVWKYSPEGLFHDAEIQKVEITDSEIIILDTFPYSFLTPYKN